VASRLPRTLSPTGGPDERQPTFGCCSGEYRDGRPDDEHQQQHGQAEPGDRRRANGRLRDAVLVSDDDIARSQSHGEFVAQARGHE
jgi:hypothetical protein